MTRAISTALKAHYASGTTTLAQCWKATLKDGTVIAATTHTEDMTIDGVLYPSISGYTPTDMESGSDLSADNLEVDGFLMSPQLTKADIQSGRWDYADIELFEVNYNDLTMGKNILRVGTLGQVTAGRSIFKAELRGLTQKYARKIVTLTTQECQANLGDAKCKIDLAAWTVNGTVSHIENNKVITDTSRTEANDWFTGGLLTFTSGQNVGLSMEIKSFTGSTIELFESMPFPIMGADSPPPRPVGPTIGTDTPLGTVVPDTYTMYAGCQKRFYQDCIGKFANSENFRGFPHVPGVGVYGPPGTSLTPTTVPGTSPGSPPVPAPPPPAPGPAPSPSPATGTVPFGPQIAMASSGVAAAPAPTTTDSSGSATINALLAGAGTTINVPSGIYMIGSPINMVSGKTLQPAAGAAVTLKATNGYTGNMVSLVGVTGASVKGFTFDGNVSTRSSVEGNDTVNAISISGGSGNTIENNTFTLTPSFAIWVFNSPGLNIRFNDFNETWEPIRIDGNNVAGTGNIENNRFTNTSAYKSIQHIDAINTKSLSIKLNSFVGAGTQTPTSHGFEGTWGNSIYIFNSDGALIENNTVNPNYWSAIVIGQNATNCVARYNHFEHGSFGGTTGGLQSSWIEQVGNDTNTFTQNLLIGGLSVGDTGADHLTITYNNITVPAGGTGMDCNSSFRHGLIAYNTIKQDTDGHTDMGIYLWDKSTVGTDISVVHNTIEGFSAGIAINNPGGTGHVYGLTITNNTYISDTTNVSVPGGLTIDASCTIQTTSVTPAPAPGPAPAPAPAGSGYPFGSRTQAYATGVVLPSDTTANLDNFCKTQYNYWASNVLHYTAAGFGVIPAGSYWPQFSGAGYSAVSEGMGYAMLITVVMAGYDGSAKTKFDGLLQFVLATPATGMSSAYASSVGDNLMSWRVTSAGTVNYPGDSWFALDGDLDIALALLMAHRQWGSSGTYNYQALAIARIGAMKVAAFLSDGTIIASQSGHASRTSDYMYGHFRAFWAATGDSFWSNAISKQLGITDFMQRIHAPSTGLLPDWVEGVDTPTPTYSSGSVGDGGANLHEAAYWYNACRDPWRSAADYVLSGDANLKITMKRMMDFFQRDSGGVVTNIVAGYELTGARIGTPNIFYAEPEFQAPVMVGCMIDASYQAFLDANWVWTKAHPTTGYYATEIQLLCAIIASGNWWSP